MITSYMEYRTMELGIMIESLQTKQKVLCDVISVLKSKRVDCKQSENEKILRYQYRQYSVAINSISNIAFTIV